MPRHNVRLFRLFGFEVKLDPSWLLLALLITWTLAAGLFPISYPGLDATTYWWMGIAGAAGIFFSIVFHEFSHSVVARRFGLPIRGITLFIFGGVAEMAEEPPHPKSEFWMAVAGPVSSLLLAFACYQIYRYGLAGSWPPSLIGVIEYLALINLVLAVFNLVPAFPLDGGRILRAGLWHWKKDLLAATRIASGIGSGFGIALMVLGVLAFIQGSFIAGMWWFLIGLFLRGAAQGSYRQLVIRNTIQGEPIRRFMNPNPVVVSPAITIQQLVDDYIYKHHFKTFPVVKDTRLLGCIGTQQVKDLPRDQWGERLVGDLLETCSPDNTVSPETDTAQVLTRLMRLASRKPLMVMADQRLLGIVSMTDLRQYIALKLDLEPPDR